MGWLLGSSTRTPTTLTSFTLPRYPVARAADSGRESPRSTSEPRPQPGLDQRRVQRDRQGGDLPGDLLGAGPTLGVALPDHRGDDLLDEPDLPVGGRAERPQVAWLDAEPRELRGALGDQQRIAVVVAGAG